MKQQIQYKNRTAQEANLKNEKIFKLQLKYNKEVQNHN